MSRTGLMRKTILMISATFACIVLGTGAPAQERGGAGANLPAGPGRELLTTACITCHNLNTVVEYRAGKPGWQDVVENMVLQGAEVLPEEAPVLIDYLANNLGPNSGSTSSKVTLPPGPGKELVEGRCSVCHAVEQAVSIRRTPDEWEKVMNQMVEAGLELTTEERRTVVSYLNAQFGKGSQ